MRDRREGVVVARHPRVSAARDKGCWCAAARRRRVPAAGGPPASVIAALLCAAGASRSGCPPFRRSAAAGITLWFRAALSSPPSLMPSKARAFRLVLLAHVRVVPAHTVAVAPCVALRSSGTPSTRLRRGAACLASRRVLPLRGAAARCRGHFSAGASTAEGRGGYGVRPCPSPWRQPPRQVWRGRLCPARAGRAVGPHSGPTHGQQASPSGRNAEGSHHRERRGVARSASPVLSHRAGVARLAHL